jgi:hypothetical protein
VPVLEAADEVGAGGVRQQVDAHTELRQLPGRLEQHAFEADRVEFQGQGEAADAGPAITTFGFLSVMTHIFPSTSDQSQRPTPARACSPGVDYLLNTGGYLSGKSSSALDERGTVPRVRAGNSRGNHHVRAGD